MISRLTLWSPVKRVRQCTAHFLLSGSHGQTPCPDLDFWAWYSQTTGLIKIINPPLNFVCSSGASCFNTQIHCTIMLAREDLILPFIFAVSSLTANDIAVVSSYYYHSDHKYSSHTPDNNHPIRNTSVYRKKMTKMKYHQLQWAAKVKKLCTQLKRSSYHSPQLKYMKFHIFTCLLHLQRLRTHKAASSSMAW